METLYVIGNGFDIYHGFCTKYSDFYLYLQLKNPEILELIEKYYYFDDTDIFWGEFENNLADFEWKDLLDNLLDYLPNISSDSFSDKDWGACSFEASSKVEALTTGLFKEFQKFILVATSAKEIYNLQKLHLQKRANYLSFNYSSTLEKHYLISPENILYIHGKAANISETIILGHGVDPSNFEEKEKEKEKEKEQPQGLTEKQLEFWREERSYEYNFSLDMAEGECLSYFKESFKNTKKIIESNKNFFLSLNRTKEVYILGHSLSDVDLPYLKKIDECLPNNCKWNISYIEEDDRLEKKEIVVNLGISKSRIKMITFNELIDN